MGTGSLKPAAIDSSHAGLRQRRERTEALDRRRVRLLEAVLAESVRLGDPQTPIGARRAEATGSAGVPPRRRARPGESVSAVAVRGSARRRDAALWAAAPAGRVA
jgi:hypothetical protein